MRFSSTGIKLAVVSVRSGSRFALCNGDWSLSFLFCFLLLIFLTEEWGDRCRAMPLLKGTC